MIRIFRRILVWGAALFALATGTAMAMVANPDPFFPHARSHGLIELRTTKPIPPEADAVLQDITNRLTQSGLVMLDTPLTLYITGGGWRERFFFALAPGAGGVALYPVAARHAFLSDADIAQDRLIKGSYTVTPPRTLAYYGAHELAHVLIARQVGLWGHATMPVWVREGVADLIALGPPDAALINRFSNSTPITLADMQAFGVYPRARVLADWHLRHSTRGVTGLLSSRLTEAEALAQMQGH